MGKTPVKFAYTLNVFKVIKGIIKWLKEDNEIIHLDEGYWIRVYPGKNYLSIRCAFCGYTIPVYFDSDRVKSCNNRIDPEKMIICHNCSTKYCICSICWFNHEEFKNIGKQMQNCINCHKIYEVKNFASIFRKKPNIPTACKNCNRAQNACGPCIHNINRKSRNMPFVDRSRINDFKYEKIVKQFKVNGDLNEL